MFRYPSIKLGNATALLIFGLLICLTTGRPPKNRTPKVSEENFLVSIRKLEKLIPSLPFEFLARSAVSVENNYTSGHPTVPTLTDLDFFNEFWQRQHTSNGTLQLHGAYLDNRNKIDNGEQLVRMILVINQLSVMQSVQLNCHLWYENLNDSVTVPVTHERLIWHDYWGYNHKDMWQPYIVSCPLPPEKRDTVPVAVSLVEINSDNVTTNCLSVVNNEKFTDKKDKFAVVLKAVDFTADLSLRLVEWIELLKILGANQIFFNYLFITSETKKTLEYYEKEGIVTLQKFKWPKGIDRTPGEKFGYVSNQIVLETIPYNDILYRNLHNYEYLGIFDLDEVIMPLGDLYNWRQLMNLIKSKINDTKRLDEIATYAFRNVYYLNEFYTEEMEPERRGVFNPETPKELYMLRHTIRFTQPLQMGLATKCFHTTDRALALHNHYAFACLGWCHIYDTEQGDGQMNHYRPNKYEVKLDQPIREDDNLNKWKAELIERSLKVMRKLGLIKRKKNRSRFNKH